MPADDGQCQLRVAAHVHGHRQVVPSSRTNRHRVSIARLFNQNLTHSFEYSDLCALMTLDYEPKSGPWNQFLTDACSSTTVRVFQSSLREREF